MPARAGPSGSPRPCPRPPILGLSRRTTGCAGTRPGDQGVAWAEERSRMTTLRRWLARALHGPETFPEEFRAERLDQPAPLARPWLR